MTHTATLQRVDASGLNLRSAPVVRPDTKVAVLARGHMVELIGPSRREGWVQVSTSIDGETVTGYVASRFLVENDRFEESEPAEGVREVHLRENRPEVRPDVDGKRAFPLGAPDRPTRNPSGAREEKLAALHAIVDWLDVETNARYLPGGSRTFCNIYAHDYCYLASVFLPRVWWNGRALARLQAGAPVSPTYGETVRELSANSLFDWLHEWGTEFGWRRVFDLDALQEAANDGGVGVIVAQRHDRNASGHIAVVVPENDEHAAIRSEGRVTRPLQSQAGTNNHRYNTLHWWTHRRFREAAFWIAP
jgi:hypothetical protein